MNKTLGGDRLGSGKKQQVHLHNYERSTHDQSYIWRSTMASGTLVPFLYEIGLPGTTFDLQLGCDIKTHPTVGPLFGSYKVQLDVFLVPMRLYNAKLHNNALGIGRNMANVKIPQIRFQAKNVGALTQKDNDNNQVNPSALPSYLGIRGIGVNQLGATGSTVPRDFNAMPFLAYWDIYGNYYAAKNEEIGCVIHANTTAITNTVTGVSVFYAPPSSAALPQSPASTSIPVSVASNSYINIAFTGATPIPTEIVFNTSMGQVQASTLINTWVDIGGGTLQGVYTGDYADHIVLYSWDYQTDATVINGEPKLATFPLTNLNDMRDAILQHATNDAFLITSTSPEPYKWLVEQPSGFANILNSQEGLAIKTYQSDLFNNWLKTENIQAISESTAIDTSGGSFTIDTLIISRKVWNMLQRIEVSGGSYDDWLDAVYVHERYRSCESPMYQGGLIKELVFQEVVSNSASEAEGSQPLGTLAGKGIMASKHKGGSMVIHVDEPSIIMGLISLTPRLDYSQGNSWMGHLKTYDNLHKPQLDEIGFQDLIMEQMHWADTRWNGTEWEQHSAGKQPAWLNYMTNVNQVRGNFAVGGENEVGEMFMTLNRRYELPDLGLGIQDMTAYIDPVKFNHIFAQKSLDAQNFWAQVSVDLTSRRKMSGKLMPNL